MSNYFPAHDDALSKLLADQPDFEIDLGDDDLTKLLADMPDVELDLQDFEINLDDDDNLSQVLAELIAVDIDLSAFDAPAAPPPALPHTLHWRKRLAMLRNIGNDPTGEPTDARE